ncbi:hypothetical protein H4R34_006044, partial [Dimargaris verticillata]
MFKLGSPLVAMTLVLLMGAHTSHGSYPYSQTYGREWFLRNGNQMVNYVPDTLHLANV